MTGQVPIRCQDLSVGHGGQAVLEGVTLSVAAGETVALVGRSGAGKTTVLRTLAGGIAPLAGEASVLGTSLPDRPPPGSLGYIPQRLGLLDHTTVRTSVLHGLLPDLGLVRRVLGRFGPEHHRMAEHAIADVGLAGYEGRRIGSLSGGQQRRVAIARTLVQQPRVLLADELLSELDHETAAGITSRIAAVQAATEAAVIVVEHDRETAAAIADRVLEVRDGEVVDV